MKILITGITGFLGSHLEKLLSQHEEFSIIGLSRTNHHRTNHPIYTLEDIEKDSTLARQIDVVINCSAINDANGYAKTEIFEENSHKPQRLIEQLRDDIHFIQISSIKVYGEGGQAIIHEESPYSPHDEYASSKIDFDEWLIESHLEKWTILRPVAVIHETHHSKLNQLLGLLKKLPINPFGRINHAKRNMIYVENLTSIILNCIDNKSAFREIFIATDSCSWSCDDLCKGISIKLKQNKIQTPLPLFVWEILAKLPKVGPLFRRFYLPYLASNDKLKHKLQWSPQVSDKDILSKMMEHI